MIVLYIDSLCVICGINI